MQKWAAIFTVNPVGRGLYLDLFDRGFRVAMLSNIAPYHLGAIERHHPDFFRVGRDHFFSFDLHLHKPDPRIYEAVCRDLGMRPDHCVFLDDLEENVRGAQSIGMQARQFTPETHQEIIDFVRSFCRLAP